jgi:hypothetical protein
MVDKALGWQITVQLADGGAPRIYNVAIAEEHEAVEAVKGTLDSAGRVVIKVKSELTERVFRALRLKPGDVMSGARRKQSTEASGRQKRS